jgi:hypothetical protein
MYNCNFRFSPALGGREEPARPGSWYLRDSGTLPIYDQNDLLVL